MTSRSIRQLVVRALSFQDNHLMVSRWENSYCFPIGGRLEQGETLEEGLLREIEEELGIAAEIARPVYFHENFFQIDDRDYHELGWFFLVRPLELNLKPGERMPNPDSNHLWTEFVPLSNLRNEQIFPRFLPTYLGDDFAAGFAENPRHIISYETSDDALDYRASEQKYE